MLYPIKRNEKYGFINENNEVVVKPKFDYIGEFSNEVCGIANKINEVHFEMDNKKYYHVESSIIDTNGVILFPFKKYLVINEFNEEVAFCYNPILKKYGVIDKVGNEVIPFIFDTSEIEYSKFSNGLAKIKKNEKYGFINKQNEVIIPCIYDNVSHFNEGFALAKINTKEFLINTNGEIFKSKYKVVSTFFEGLAKVKQNKKFGFINKDNVLVIDFLFDSVWNNFKEGYCLVSLDKKFGLIDKLGNVVLDFQYSDVRSIGNNVFPAKIKNKWTLVNINGNVQFEPKFEYIDDFDKAQYELDYKNSNLTRAVYKRKDYYIDFFGNIVNEIDSIEKNFDLNEIQNLLVQKIDKKEVWDKAKWSYDGFTVTKKGAIRPFYFILNWFEKKKLLTNSGLEALNDKNNLEIGLYRFMFQEKAAVFLDYFYQHWYEKQHIANYQLDSDLEFEGDENLEKYWELFNKNYG